MAVTAVFAADFAQHRLTEARHVYSTERLAASLSQTIPEGMDRTSALAPASGLRAAGAAGAAGAAAAPAARWRLPEPFDYHLTAFDAADTADLAPARESQGDEETPRPQDGHGPRLQF